jgi:hypothetical protein
VPPFPCLRKDRIVAMVEPLPFRRLHGALVLDGLLRDHLTKTLPQSPLQHGGWIERLRSCRLLLGAVQAPATATCRHPA